MTEELCRNCGHAKSRHNSRHGCTAIDGQLECKCYHFRGGC